jgi:dCTP diphosphatase
MTLALAGEVGELANLIKKIERGSLNFNDAKVQFEVHMETTDVFIYLLNIAGLLRIDLEAAYRVKRAENERRFGPGAQSNGAGTQRLVRPDVPGATREG